MFYTVQELLAQIKAWEYYIAVLFLATFILYWWALSRAPKRRLRLQPSRVASQPPLMRYERDEGNAARPNTGRPPTPCWEARQCPPGVRLSCPAYGLAPLPCWFARLLMLGQVWEPCLACSIYSRDMERLRGAARKKSPGDPLPESVPVEQKGVC